MIMVNQNILILRPKFNIFWAIFIRLFLTFNTSGEKENQLTKGDHVFSKQLQRNGEVVHVGKS
ncbi:MAG: hypothetical protein AN488_21245, partial [Anabaena sp. WA113]